MSGIVAATYRSSPKNQVHHANRKTFVTLQYQTYTERKATSDTMYESSSLSAKAVQERLKMMKSDEEKTKKEKKKKEAKPPKIKPVKQKKKKIEDYEDWDEIMAGEDDDF